MPFKYYLNEPFLDGKEGEYVAQVLQTGWLSAGGVVASVVFVVVQLMLIKAICIYCFVSAGIAFLLFAVAYRLWKRTEESSLVTILES